MMSMSLHALGRLRAWSTLALAALLLVSCGDSGGGDAGASSCDAACWTCTRACDRAQSCDYLEPGTLAQCKRACRFDPLAMLDDSDNPECTEGCCVFPSKIRFSRAYVLGAHRAVRRDDGVWHRQCDGGAADGVALDLALVTTLRLGGEDEAVDRDLGVRPGDVVDWRVVDGGEPEDAVVAGTGSITLAIDAFAPQPPSEAGPATSPALGPAAVHFADNVAARGAGQDVLVLIDLSGSVSGLVDPERDYRESPMGTFIPPPNFGDLASDPYNLRLSAARRLIRVLDDRDRVGAVGFGEGVGLDVPCSLAQGDVEADLAACFGEDRDVWLSTNGIDAAIGRASGRSNLWQAVGFAVDWLGARGAEAPERGRHVLVITDGPDTCSGEALGDCQAPCSDVTAAGVRAQVAALEAAGTPVRLHFVQLESIGYRGRDPRQVAAACASGGHYQYVNSADFPRNSAVQLQEALDTAVVNLRYGFGGHWTAGVPIPAWSATDDSEDLAPGALYALTGEVVVNAASRLMTQSRPFRFGVGEGEGAASAVAWDRRPTLRAPCASAADCGAAAEPDTCRLICSPETLVCTGGAAGTLAPDLGPCGEGGFCCAGACRSGGQCEACE